ncbi:class I SAM-dependent methyltransferase [Dictyobacter aurantiacus]|uniref:Methyltransferase domain-containing protein n=1 Tax=Dictyobacter aurantiacus TaxID=1936993 RepID=A0A401ZGQ8_9CHLR|nr:methyltransferase domain-containing protein [Dictyobacter aurantiacus]GCE06026.1 hypothetical protein KDAU_33550 [Dictyobacter aurantiacus]
MLNYLRFTCDLDQPLTASAIDECSLWASRFGSLLLDNLELHADLHILDLACGTGFPLFELAHMYGTSCRVTGIDNWKEGIERARAKLDVYQLPNVQIVEADAAHLPFPAESFDLITANLGINNFTDPEVVLAECFRVGRPEARLALTTNPIGHMREFYAVFRSILEEQHRDHYLERLAQNEAHRGSKEALIELVGRSGFRIVKIKEEQFQFRSLNGSALLNHFLTKIGFLGGWRRVIEPGDEASIFAELERRLNQLAEAQGELRLTIPMLYLEAEKSATRPSLS